VTPSGALKFLEIMYPAQLRLPMVRPSGLLLKRASRADKNDNDTKSKTIHITNRAIKRLLIFFILANTNQLTLSFDIKTIVAQTKK
jgi:hypothetical protein